MVFNLSFANDTVLTPAVITQMFNPIEELAIRLGTPISKTKSRNLNTTSDLRN